MLFTGWLEPLLDRVATGEPLIVAPEINTIDDHTFEVKGGQYGLLGGLDLEKLEFEWFKSTEERMKNHSVQEPYKLVHMAKLISPYLCFISFLYLDLYVFGDDALIS